MHERNKFSSPRASNHFDLDRAAQQVRKVNFRVHPRSSLKCLMECCREFFQSFSLALSFFSEHPTFNNTPFYIAFQLKPSSKITGEHQIKSTPIEYVVESNDSENPIIVDGDASLFVSGRAVVYEAEFNNENELIYIEIAYWINWEGITIKGFYKGSVI